MASETDFAQHAVCLAICLGWRIAELYDSKELPGPPQRHENGELPDHLPGLGEMSKHERACALVAHVSADLAALERALGLAKMPGTEGISCALQEPRHNRDAVREVILGLYIDIRNLLAGNNVSAALGFGLGRMLADTALLPTAGCPEIIAERFEEYRLANAFRWLDDLDASLPPHSAAAVRATLAEWQRWVAGLPRSASGAIDPAQIDRNTIRRLRQQGEIWRRLLTGEQRPDQLLDRKAYIGAATRLLSGACRIGFHYFWKWSWSIVLLAGAVGAGFWAVLTYAPVETNQVAAIAASAAGFLSISWLGIRATLGRALRQAESALWETEVAAAIAHAATIRPNAKRGAA
jgi:hypothetical protein